MSFVGKNPRFESTILTDQTSSSVTSPASGSHKLVDRSGVLYLKDSSGNESPIGAGSGGINLVTSPSVSTGWVASGAGVTVATSTTSTDLPFGTTSIKLTPVSGTDYVRFRFTMPASLKQSLQSLSWLQRPLSGYAAGDFKVDVYVNSASDYSGSYTRVALSTDASAVTSIPAATGTFTSSFVADTNDYYELRVVRTAGTTALNLANVFVGVPQRITSPAVGTPIAWTPTFTGFGTVGNISMYYTRVGTKLKAKGTFKTGTPTGVLAKLTLPSGLTVDSTYSTMSQNRLGIATANSGAASAVFDSGIGFAVIYDSTDSSSVYFAYQTDTTGNDKAITAQNGSALFNASSRVVLDFEVDIAEWAGSGVVNVGQNDVEYASVAGTWDAASTTTVAGPAGSIMGGALAAAREKTITWPTPVQATDRIEIWASKDQVNWFPINGAQLGASNTPVIPSVNAAGTVAAGVAWRPGATAYETIVTFGQYVSVANDDSPVVDWPSSAAYWVATKAKSGQAVGFGLASTTQVGLVKANRQYINGTAYANGTPTLTSANSGFSVSRGVFVPYQTYDGAWRLRFNIRATCDATTDFNMTLSGITISSVQAINGHQLDSSTGRYTNLSATNISSSNRLDVYVSTASTTFAASGDIEIASKPTWAD